MGTYVITLQLTCVVSLGLVAYCYVGYPLLVILCARLIGRRPRTEFSTLRPPQDWPRVSLIIAAYREEKVILQRIHNALRMDYPADRIEVIIGCDGNEDATGDLVRTVDDSRIRLLQFPERRGKPSVLNDCVAAAGGEIIAFSDANTFHEPDALKKLVRHFDIEHVGGVVGRLVLVDPDTGRNVDGKYWAVENVLKKSEASLGALLGANGAIYALRKSLWQPIAPRTIVDDFVIGMRVHLARRRLVFEEQAVAIEETAPSIEAEFHRRARIGAGGFQSLAWLAPLLHPRFGFVAWAFWSHKVLRWLTPLFLLAGLVANLFLIDNPFWLRVLLLQGLVYAGALAGMLLPPHWRAGRLLRMATMFFSMNVALGVGFWRWVRQRQSGAWKRTPRTAEVPESSTRQAV